MTAQDNPVAVWALHAGVDQTLQLPNANFRPVVRLGLLIVALGFGGFLLWASLAPLDEGVPANGSVVVETSRKSINHLNGGLVERILVREGQEVKAGDELVVLNEIQSRAALNATLNQWHVAQATVARLRAERGSAAAPEFARELIKAAGTDPEVAALVRAQESLFRTRRTALRGELSIIEAAVRGLETQLSSLAQLKTGRETQIALFEEQLTSYRKLRGDGFVSRNQVLEVERQLAEVQSKQSEDLANIAGINARLADLRMRGVQRETENRSEVEKQLADAQRDAATLGERLSAQRDTVSRLALRAPVAGTVVDLAVHTVGGVVKPGDRVMDIVPKGDSLIVEARVAPQYVDRLHPGQPADVHFDSYTGRVTRPVIRGQVSVVSADVLVDTRSGAPYYNMRVAIPAEEATRLGHLKLQAGMVATVMVKTGERSFLTYLTAPLLRRSITALGEQ